MQEEFSRDSNCGAGTLDVLSFFKSDVENENLWFITLLKHFGNMRTSVVTLWTPLWINSFLTGK